MSPSTDRGSRVSTALALQRLAGNRAVALAATSSAEAIGFGSCTAGPDLECSAKADRRSSKKLSVPVPTKKKDREGNVTYKATGAVTGTFTTKVNISLASAPDGLSKCANKVIQGLINTKLKPHEDDHKRRFTTADPQHAYSGTWTAKVTETGDDPATVQSSIASQLETLFSDQASLRAERNDAYAIAAIDPFHVTADISACPECAAED